MQKKVAIIIVLFLLLSVSFYKSLKFSNAVAGDSFSGQVLGAFDTYDAFDEKQKLHFGLDGFPLSENKYLGPQKKEQNDFNLEGINIAYAIDEETEKPLFGHGEDFKVGIASITKLATALTFLDIGLNLDDVYKISGNDRVNEGRVYVYSGDEVRLKDLLHISLIASDNTATCALVKSTGMTEAEFVNKMNEKMLEIGLENTVFYDPIGLKNNISTAKDVSKLAKAALSNGIIADIVGKEGYNFETIGGKDRAVYSTDSLLDNYPKNGIELHGGKTGFTNLAGYCFVGKFSKDGKNIISVILGSSSTYSRFTETERLVNWVYDSFVW